VGIGFVFLIYLIVLAVLAVPGMLVCGSIGYFLTRRRSASVRRSFVIGGALLPLAGAAYAVFGIIVMAVAGLIGGGDVGFGDGYDVPLRNHYHWSAIDEPTVAEVYDTGDRDATDNGDTHIEPDDRNAFSNVLQFQQDGDWLAGSYDSDQAQLDSRKMKSDRWFLFNTRTHERVDVSSEDELRRAAAANGVPLRLQSSEDFYASHHLTWTDGVVASLLLAGAVLALAFLWRAGKRRLAADMLEAT